jgi:hypothetical protein
MQKSDEPEKDLNIRLRSPESGGAFHAREIAI